MAMLQKPEKAARSSPPSRAGGAGVDRPVRTEGQRLLRAVGASLGQVAERCGATRQAVSLWRGGQRVPDGGWRRALEEHYGIPTSAWERAPKVGAAATPVLEVARGAPTQARPGTADEIEELLETVRAARRDPGLVHSERIRAAAEERALLALRERLARQTDERESDLEDLVVRHPRWLAALERITRALVPYPDAALAVAAELGELEREREDG